MDEQRKNPYRRERAKPHVRSGEKRPGLRQLPNDLHDLAEGRVDRLRRPRRQPDSQLEDERGGHVIPGVRNSEARTVYDRRVQLLRVALEKNDEPALRRGLCEAVCLGLWRARNITDFEAFAEHVLTIEPARARQYVTEAVPAPKPLIPEVAALWIRMEATAMRLCPTAVVHLAEGEEPRLQLELPTQPIGDVIETIKSLGPAVTGLGRLLGG